MKTPAGMGKQSKVYVNQRVKKKTSRIKNQLKKNDSLNDQLKENDSLNNNKSNCHTTSPSTNDIFLIHPYICKMKHFIRTAYGDSDWSYCGSPSKPLQGAVQGNGAASQFYPF